jgi:transmembrane sensor
MSTIYSQIFDEASEWFVTLRYEAAGPALQERFMAWLRQSPDHVSAYLGIVALWMDLPAVDAGKQMDAEALIALARAEGNVFALEPRATPPLRRSRLRRRGMAVAAAVLVCVTAGVLGWLNFVHAPHYSTRIGEQRALTLADGSRVELNSNSRIRVRFDESRRSVELLRGQALFQVARDAKRPFTVDSETARVRAVGTQFDVLRKGGETVVTVVEGRVAVSPLPRAPRKVRTDGMDAEPSTAESADDTQAQRAPILLSAGEQIVMASVAVRSPVRANVAAATAWTRGQLMFTSMPLSQVVEEFNRYNTRPLKLGSNDPAITDLPITAVFSSTDPRMLIEFLRQQPDLNVKVDGGEILIVPMGATSEAFAK